MAKSIEEVLTKALAKLDVLAAKKQAIKEGRPLSITTALNTLERSQRSLEKGREAYIKDVLNNRDCILGQDLPMDAIRDGRLIADKALKQAQTIIQGGWKKKMLLAFDLAICELKEKVASIDIDAIVDASQCYDDFIEGLNDYTLDTIGKVEAIKREKIQHLWNLCMPTKHQTVLSRTATPYDAIDRFRADAIQGINKAATIEEAQKAIDNFEYEVNIWFEKRGVDCRVNE